MSEFPTAKQSGFVTPEGMIRFPTSDEIACMEQQRAEKEANDREASKRRHEAFKKEKRKGRVIKSIAAIAMFASVKSGGLIDMTGDSFSEAGETVAGAIQPSRADIPDKMDSIPFEDYSKKVRDEVIAERTQSAELKNSARAEVIDIFRRIDSDGTDWLLASVESEKAAHAELYVSSERAELARQAIDSAESNVMAVSELNDFMNEYGISAEFEDGEYSDKQAQTKKALIAYVNVFSVLPKDLIADSQLETVAVSGKTVQSTDDEGNPGHSMRGSYLESDNLITVYADNLLETAVFTVSDVVPNIESSYEQTVAHELGHAIDHKMPIGAMLDTPDNVIESAKSYGSRIVNGAIGRPEVPSMYSREDSGEYAAELLAGLLSDSEAGLALPNEWRKFGSGSNLAMIEMLADLEAQRPGIAKILIANRI